MQYVRALNKATMTPEEEEYWQRKMEAQQLLTDAAQRLIIAPNLKDVNAAVRKIRKYFIDREVE